MKFIADAMLGRLAKWLRLSGFDVAYYPDISDRQVIKIAREEERTILTRDTRLLKCKGAGNAVFIQSDHISEQLCEMKNMLDFNDPELAERCVACNGRLQKVEDRDEVKGLVPDHVYYNYGGFTRCGSCGKVYWKGSHYKNIRERIRETLGKGIED
ncbi:MAG: Mut7-C RNAse domain-containing protein [Nitrospirota bacterium]|nr:Mut7-C RNAse domain-containing protein [Nitrospirota bacterium]